MEIIELILDEETQELNGIEAVSIVENPAIESDFIALKDQEVKLAKIDEEKRLLMGAALIPNKPIFRKKEDDMFYVYFSENTVRRASELFFIQGNQNNATLEHQMTINGLTVVESWIVEDTKMDKSVKYGLEVPKGTWMISMKVENDEIWNEYVKNNRVKGFSIEGYFADKAKLDFNSVKTVNLDVINNELSNIEEKEANLMLSKVRKAIKTPTNTANRVKIALESFKDYPDAVSNNAKRGIELNEKVNNKCATQVGKVRAQTLAQKEPISTDTLKRMYSYLSRAEVNYDEGDTQACGTISFLLWGGLAGLRWSASKLKELGEIDLENMVIDENLAIINDRLAYDTQEKAEKIAQDLGCEGFHTHELEEKTWYMPCEQHELKEPCWKGYEMIGFKIKNGKKVPNCVPIA